MTNKQNILDFNFDIITGNLYNAVISLSNGRNFVPSMGVKNVYFVGRTLCMDYNGDIITLNHSEETVGFLSGGIRRLLSIKNMQLFEALMDLCEIGHNQKWVTKRIVNS